MFRSNHASFDHFLHKNTEEEENQRLQCKFCSKSDLSETDLLLHQSHKHAKKLKEFLNQNPFHCRICIKDCESADNLLEHVKTEHLFTSADSFRVQREIFICDYCGKIFFNKQFLEVHCMDYHMKINKIMTCLICPKKFFVRNAWFHLQGHDIQNIAMCPICFAKCRNKKLLQDHMKTHARHLQCEMCMYTTKREDYFRQHIIDVHKVNITCGKDKPFEMYFTPESTVAWTYQKLGSHAIQLTNDIRICILCREVCVGESNMQQHIFVEHKGQAPAVKTKHLCTCGELFTNKVLLKHHTFKLKGDHKMLE